MMKPASRFCFWHLLVALASLNAASPQSSSRQPSQLYETPRRPQAAVLPTQLPQSRPPAPQVPTVPPPRPANLPRDQVGRPSRPVATSNLPSAPARPPAARPNQLYTQPDPAGVPLNEQYGVPASFLPPQTPSQLYQQPAGDASDDRQGSVVFPVPSDFPAPPATRPFPTQRPLPPAPRPIPTTPPAGAMMGMPYDFEWDVQDAESGNIYSHNESSDGSVTRGEYKVLLPDGRLQIVQFVDRGNGYEAKVSYEIYDGQLQQNF